MMVFFVSISTASVDASNNQQAAQPRFADQSPHKATITRIWIAKD
jgi:hypothetical protein